MAKKKDILLLKIKSYLCFKKIIFFNYKCSILYIEIILLSILLSLLFPTLVNILQHCEMLPDYNISELRDNYYDLYINSGISLIGLTALVFTLKTFKQESLNEYMNSVFQKMFNTKLDTYIQYFYLCIIALLFLLFPHTNFFRDNLSYFIPFYYLSIVSVLLIFGLELINISNKMNKDSILKDIENRVKCLYDMGEKFSLYYNNFEAKYNYKKTPKLLFIEKMNDTFVTYTQCINLIIKKSFDDPIVFVNAMNTLYEITKYRLEKRKNSFNDYSVPLLSEILPNKSNDVFIENYLLEYLDDYSKLSLESRNRDNMATIERMYKQLLLAGKNNRYINNNNLELTIKIIFIYYMKLLDNIVEFNNENMLFQSIEIFKELFIKNSEYFNELIDKTFCDSIFSLSKKSLDKKSLMNYRNVQGLLVIGLESVLYNDNEYRDVYLDEIFKTLKQDLILLCEKRCIITEYDGARLALNYVFNSIDPLSLLSIFRNYYNENISETGDFISEELLLKNDFERLEKFLNDKDVMAAITILHNKKYFVTCSVNLSSISEFLLHVSACIYSSTNNDYIRKKYYDLFNEILILSSKYINNFNEKSNMIRYELNHFYSHIVHLSLPIIKQNEQLRNILLKNYEYSILDTYKDFDGEFSIEDILEYFKFICDIFDDNKDEEIKKVLYRIKEKCSDFKTIIKEYIDIKNRNHSLIGFKNRDINNYLEPILHNIILDYINSLKKKELLILYFDLSKVKIQTNMKKEKIILLIMEFIEK